MPWDMTTVTHKQYNPLFMLRRCAGDVCAFMHVLSTLSQPPTPPWGPQARRCTTSILCARASPPQAACTYICITFMPSRLVAPPQDRFVHGGGRQHPQQAHAQHRRPGLAAGEWLLNLNPPSPLPTFPTFPQPRPVYCRAPRCTLSTSQKRITTSLMGGSVTGGGRAIPARDGDGEIRVGPDKNGTLFN
jgi:hypothetical protein